MTKISYFQRFSQRENHATNNTLLLFRYLYQDSPKKIETVLSSLTEEPLEIGLLFEQQIQGSASVPDALIAQKPIDLYFETKRGGELDAEQIERHISSIKGDGRRGSRKYLFGLTRDVISQNERNELIDKASKAGITFVAITFADIVQAIRQVCAPHETELHDILADYEEYLQSEELMQTGETLIVVPCGTTINENVEYLLYFEPATRPSKSRAKFLGFYHQKHVCYLGDLETIITGKTTDGKFQKTSVEKGTLSKEQLARIEAAIKACTYYPNFSENEHRYYLFGELHPTSIEKISKGGIWGPRVFNLSDWIGYEDLTKEYSSAEAANLLSGKTFE